MLCGNRNIFMSFSLVGYPPFTDERQDADLKTQIMRGLYKFPDEFWKDISNEAKDLVSRLMCVDPAKRISLEVRSWPLLVTC